MNNLRTTANLLILGPGTLTSPLPKLHLPHNNPARTSYLFDNQTQKSLTFEISLPSYAHLKWRSNSKVSNNLIPTKGSNLIQRTVVCSQAVLKAWFLHSLNKEACRHSSNKRAARQLHSLSKAASTVLAASLATLKLHCGKCIATCLISSQCPWIYPRSSLVTFWKLISMAMISIAVLSANKYASLPRSFNFHRPHLVHVTDSSYQDGRA